jgi:hypothetical protein
MHGGNHSLTQARHILAAVCLALGGCGGGGGQPGQDISRGLQSEDPSQRVQAAVRAGNAHMRQAVPLLVDRLDDPDVEVRFAAIGALRRIIGEDFDYRFNEPASRRAAAVGRWRQWLEREGRPASRPASAPASQGVQP